MDQLHAKKTYEKSNLKVNGAKKETDRRLR
jgi:hypothetical protein